MGERKGQNHYYPPDFDYKKHKTLNAYHGVHALRERASKIGQGILVIRFEMPFNIWCLGCNNHVGMGVRYNAEKKKIGMYYTTPLYEFRMKCHLCDNYYVIRTDPKNFDYELVEGCSRQEKRFDPSEMDGVAPIDRGHSLKLAADAMYKAEHQEEDVFNASKDGKQIDKLEWLQERMRDDFAANSALRRSFRSEKKDLKEQRAADDDLRRRASLQIKLVPESADDRKVAGMLKRYANVKSFDEHQQELRESIESRRIFGDSKPGTSASSSSAPSTAADRIIATLRQKRGKQLNEKFERGLKRAAAEGGGIPKLGIVLGKKPKPEAGDGSCSGCAASPHDDELIEIKKGEDTVANGSTVSINGRDTVEVKEEEDDEEEEKKQPPALNPLALLAEYSYSSDSE